MSFGRSERFLGPAETDRNQQISRKVSAMPSMGGGPVKSQGSLLEAIGRIPPDSGRGGGDDRFLGPPQIGPGGRGDFVGPPLPPPPGRGPGFVGPPAIGPGGGPGFVGPPQQGPPNGIVGPPLQDQIGPGFVGPPQQGPPGGPGFIGPPIQDQINPGFVGPPQQQQDGLIGGLGQGTMQPFIQMLMQAFGGGGGQQMVGPPQQAPSPQGQFTGPPVQGGGGFDQLGIQNFLAQLFGGV